MPGNNPTLRVDPNGKDWYVHERDKLEGGVSVRALVYEWFSSNQSLIRTPARSFIHRFDSGPVTGLVVLDKWENRYKQVSTMAEARAQFEAYRTQAALNFLAGVAEASSLTLELSGALNHFSIERDSEQFRLGTNVGIIGSSMAVAGGVGGGFYWALKRAGLTTKVLKDVRIFSKDLFRANLIKATGVDPGALAQAHHVFPKI